MEFARTLTNLYWQTLATCSWFHRQYIYIYTFTCVYNYIFLNYQHSPWKMMVGRNLGCSLFRGNVKALRCISRDFALLQCFSYWSILSNSEFDQLDWDFANIVFFKLQAHLVSVTGPCGRLWRRTWITVFQMQLIGRFGSAAKNAVKSDARRLVLPEILKESLDWHSRLFFSGW